MGRGGDLEADVHGGVPLADGPGVAPAAGPANGGGMGDGGESRGEEGGSGRVGPLNGKTASLVVGRDRNTKTDSGREKGTVVSGII